MHNHPRYWRLPFPSNDGAFNPNIKVSKDKLVIRERGLRQYLLFALYVLCACILSILVPLEYLPEKYRFIGIIIIASLLAIAGFLHFNRTFIRTKIIYDKEINSLSLSIRGLVKNIPITKIKALQIYPEKCEWEDLDTGRIDYEMVYHCYALMLTTAGEPARMGLFVNRDRRKHATDCLELINLCKNYDIKLDIWEACGPEAGSIFSTEQKLENPTTINCFRLDGSGSKCC